MPVPIATPVQPRRLLVDTIHDQIRDWIFSGALTPGEVLHDAEIGAAMGASRSPIREALNRLAAAGLVETAPNRYTRVALTDPSQVSDAQAALETLVSALDTSAEQRAALLSRISSAAGGAAAGELMQLRAEILGAASRDNPLLGHTLAPGLDGLLYRLSGSHV